MHGKRRKRGEEDQAWIWFMYRPTGEVDISSYAVNALHCALLLVSLFFGEVFFLEKCITTLLVFALFGKVLFIFTSSPINH